MFPYRLFKWIALGLGFAFLYIPIVSLIVYSFNDSALTSSWVGFSLRWYKDLYHDEALLRAAWLSIKIAVFSATMATLIGTWAGYVLVRKGPFKGFALYIGMLNLPLVIPDVILGISVLLMVIELRNLVGFPEANGVFTIWLGHVTLCIAYVSVVISTRVRELDTSIEYAALDLGATPLKVFFTITLPMIAPAVVSAWLLAFTLSLDDVVIASFLNGPGYTTLPIEIFSRVRLGVKPEVNALATILVVGIGAIVIIANRIQIKKSSALE
ncbi:ABC transporter permease subunit [Taylorella equigenitalis]|uniref:Putrescine transport system permease protein PotI n=3 Tax=Taylorella equigenitalis TaxID=29575 RepID=A0A654KIM2_TAYEM|nr:ABC transporter permease subunit [Taylorella equigenitalis]ADU92250.1 Putrescine transport system permease protein PotI [Taylorella equigenitalis MCE9]AFN35804.1 putative inner membrane putrescine permease transport protein [Taylorella equigenitalis ATCC 35865]ASY30444.1 putrescine ABC transporter permease PotI [Taylorella equigenitalis]ASY37751.1 putrescine ABC transporter permease PotI [Taylorella equigenitalis]ASY39219.1 putrescine ABC transporter permease PotI [Taylorella equigenitalis]